MRTKQKRVAALTATQNNNLQKQTYKRSAYVSTKKFLELTANLLIGLQAETLTAQQSKHGWQLFEVVLRHYIDLKIPGRPL